MKGISMNRLFSAMLILAALPVFSQELDWVFTRDEAAARERLVGSGIPTLHAGVFPATEGTEWREHRAAVDDSGITHTFFRQYYVSRGTTPALVEGSEVGVHRSASGTILLVAGHQFRKVVPENGVLFGPAAAVLRAAQAAGERPGLFSEALDIASLETAKRLEFTKLVLVSTDRETFRFVYRTPVRKHDGLYAEAEIDSATLEWRTSRDYGSEANCSPSNPAGSPIGVTATGVRNLSRSVKATLGGGRPSASFDYDAFAKADTSLPGILVYHAVDSKNPAHLGFTCGSSDYTLHPLRSADSPLYAELDVDGNGSVDWYGKDAADAFHNASETMSALRGMGMSSWNGGSTRRGESPVNARQRKIL
jgi:hypothetical protein